MTGAQPVERPPETRGVAGSIPAGHIARRTRPTRSARGRTATGAVPRLENGWLSRAWGFDSLSFRLGSVAQQAELPALNRAVAGSTPAGALFSDRAPEAGVRRASPQDPRRGARSEAWPSGKAAPCYGVGASAGSIPAASVFRPVAQRQRAVGFEPTRARSSRAGAFERGGTQGSPTSPLLPRRAQATGSWPPGRQSRPPAATAAPQATVPPTCRG